VEYELAYLQVFNTVGETFFDVYYAHTPKRNGYELRRLVYWLNTMIIHVDHFGNEYLPPLKQIMKTLYQMM
jgi:fructosamine-3-kinase